MSKIPAAKRRRLSPPDDAGSASKSRKTQAAFIENDLEATYEQRRRKLKAKEKQNNKLPIRTAEGWMEQQVVPEEKKVEEEEESDSFLGSGSDGEDEDGEQEPEVVQEAPKVPIKQQIREAKEELARIAVLVNEDPEEHIGALKTLGQIAQSEVTAIRKLALATQVAVFKDLIPGYRIRPISDDDMGQKLSKEVRKLRNFEQKLVSSYQFYVRDLASLAKKSGSGHSDEAGLATVAISCACNLLLAVPHFNFRGDILKILVDKLSIRKVDADFIKCRETLEQLFRTDEDGNATLDAVTMLTKMMKGRHYNFDESVLNTFLHLRLLDEFHHKASYNSVDKAEEPEYAGKKIKPKREFRTKKLRKQLKEQKAIENEFKEADAAVSHEERDRMQAETLKMVFVAYFRILKARTRSLMGAVLEGLAKYAHLINQDFFGDILEALRDMITRDEMAMDDVDSEDEGADEDDDRSRNASRESLLCVITAFALLQGQDAAASASNLKLDLSFFITHLYRTLHPVSLNPDLELSSKSLHLPDPNSHESDAQSAVMNKVNVQTTVVLLIRSLSSVLLPATAVRAVPPVRVAAFCKQLMTVSLQLPEKSCMAMLGLLTQITKTHGRKVGSLWNTEERRGDGVFNALTAEIEQSNPFAATVWETELLRKHYCPKVRDALKGITRNVLEAR